MKDVLFSHNWNNKLNCTYFTTLRMSDRLNKGDFVRIMLKATVTGYGYVVEKKRTSMGALKGNDFICGLDTGYTPAETPGILRTMYKGKEIQDDTPLFLYLIRYETKEEKKERETQSMSQQTTIV